MSGDTATSGRRTPKQQRGRETYDAILDAAAAIVVEDGLDRLSTTGVAEEAGLAVGSVYQYFDDVDAILAAIVDSHLEAFRALVRNTTASREFESAEEAGVALAHAVADYCRREPSFRRIWFGAPLVAGSRREPPLDDEAFVGLFRDLLAESGLLDGHDPEADVSILVRWSVAEALLELAFRLDPDGDARVLDRLDHLLRLETWTG